MDIEASRRGVQPQRPLVDIGLAKTVLRGALEALDDRNLDDLPELSGVNTITEPTTLHIPTKLAAAHCDGPLGAGRRTVSRLKVLLRENPNAWTAYETPIGLACLRDSRLRVSSAHASPSCRRTPASTNVLAARRQVVDA